MLVLTRKVGESIVIEGGITVTVTKVEGDRIRIGVSAQRGVRIDREEVALRLQEWAEPSRPGTRELAAV